MTFGQSCQAYGRNVRRELRTAFSGNRDPRALGPMRFQNRMNNRATTFELAQAMDETRRPHHHGGPQAFCVWRIPTYIGQDTYSVCDMGI